ncbi:uncharacterized protein PHALS_03432 [Plasmopara halstedii]|uniref:Uncharacterized protein n=1 Tax=Plasmopara halstedii TaxID=4781 RepID=A0A0P1AYK5_PLAHL|nr:uncharacterized protein PHALS_03432 [Plasmopara halstedii]CEG46748.1 hypothetical protein PHALS_03432 [Plasmopara halstedii]|eukprot:XP_024583117.1 hypothetical protein PHALS_03432 [Plasmopara halstedii]
MIIGFTTLGKGNDAVCEFKSSEFLNIPTSPERFFWCGGAINLQHLFEIKYATR